MILGNIIGKVFLLLAIAGAVFLFFAVPFGKNLIDCYEKNVLTFDDINASAQNYGWNDQRVCELKADSVKSLDICITQAKSGTQLPLSLQNTVINFLPNVRPNTETLEMRVERHNEECRNYPPTLLNQPE